MMRQIVEKVPHVHGKSCELMVELIDEIRFVEDWRRWEKSCTVRYFPGFPGLGTRERGEDWKGPIMASSSFLEKGLMYRPF